MTTNTPTHVCPQSSKETPMTGSEHPRPDALREAAEQAFERYPALTRHIMRMAASGTVGSLIEWGDFIHDLNAALSASPSPGGVSGEDVARLTNLADCQAVIGHNHKVEGRDDLADDHKENARALRRILAALTSPAPADGVAVTDVEAVREALKCAVGHLEHMAAWISETNKKAMSSLYVYSFESLGEDMPSFRAALSTNTGEGKEDE